ncbi:MAG: MBOAT family protein, partial [Lachnospiraceae bacterium]|nr:MBOAT family protein [Lachnospiraceae bacterium]
RRKWLLAALLFNLGILSVCKYTNFAIVNVNALLHFFGRFSGGGAFQLPLVNILLPLGISFYTFQSLGYLIDVYRGKYPAQGDLFQYALFVGFFPQLIQGPISRYNDLSETMLSPHSFSAADFSLGMERILWGYFKKLVIADRLLPAVNEIIRNPESYQGAFVFVGMLFYALELYADFTGGIDITIGIAQALGIRVQENFIRPYFSKSVKEYWRRWHISMGTWFTDYIFYPVSVCGPMLSLSKWARKHLGSFVGKRITVWLSCIIVWFATGVWHGASWNFIVWGLANCAILLVSQELEPFYRAFHGKVNHLLMKDHQFIPLEDRAVWKCFQIVRTVLIMSCLRMFDCYRDVPLTFKMFASMFARWDFSIFANGSLLALGLDLPDYALLAFSLLLLITVSLLQRKGSVRAAIGAKSPAVRFVIWFGLFLAVLVFGAYGQGYDQSQFIYNQF